MNQSAPAVAGIETPKRDILDVRTPNFRIARIQDEVCAKYGYTRSALLSMRRKRKLSAARHEAIRRAETETDASLTTIAAAFRRDISTILYVLGHKKRSPAKEKVA